MALEYRELATRLRKRIADGYNQDWHMARTPEQAQDDIDAEINAMSNIELLDALESVLDAD